MLIVSENREFDSGPRRLLLQSSGAERNGEVL